MCHSICEGQRGFTMPHPRDSACASRIAASPTGVRWRACTLLGRFWHCANSNAVSVWRCGVLPASSTGMRRRKGVQHSTAADMHAGRVLHATDSRYAVCVRGTLFAIELSCELLASAAIAHVKSSLRHHRARALRRKGKSPLTLLAAPACQTPVRAPHFGFASLRRWCGRQLSVLFRRRWTRIR